MRPGFLEIYKSSCLYELIAVAPLALYTLFLEYSHISFNRVMPPVQPCLHLMHQEPN